MLRNIIHLLSDERERLLLRLVKAQEDFFQRRLMGRNVGCAVLARDVNDLHQVTLDTQLQGVLICAPSHAGYARDLLEPLDRGRASKGDLYIVLADLFKRRHVIDLDQPSLADDRHAVASMLDLGQDVRGEEDGTSLSTHLRDHTTEFLLVEWVQS